MLPLTLQFVIAMIASAINERMRRKLDYALEENRILKEAFRAATGTERIHSTPDRRRRLALAGKELTPKERNVHVRSWSICLSARAHMRNSCGARRAP